MAVQLQGIKSTTLGGLSGEKSLDASLSGLPVEGRGGGEVGEKKVRERNELVSEARCSPGIL